MFKLFKRPHIHNFNFNRISTQESIEIVKRLINGEVLKARYFCKCGKERRKYIGILLTSGEWDDEKTK